MSFFRTRKEAPPPTPKAEWKIDPLVIQISRLATAWEERVVSPVLVCARWGDVCRDAGQSPLAPVEFERSTKWFDMSAMHRLWLAINLFDTTMGQQVLTQIIKTSASAVYFGGLIPAVEETPLLTGKLFRQSDLRCEEFARRLSDKLKVGIVGETEIESASKLDRLDYTRLVAEAEKARSSAAERMTYLTQKLEEEQAKRRPRGKW